MASNKGNTWDQNVPRQSYPPLAGDIAVDVAIIGGGITGILTAYLLSQAGKKVALIEQYLLVYGATGATTGFLSQAIDTDLVDLIRIWGARDASLIIRSHGQATDLIESIVITEKIDCEFTRCDNYTYAATPTDNTGLKKEHTAASQIGLSTTMQKGVLFGSDTRDYLAMPGQAKIHPLKFLLTLAAKIASRDVLIYEHTTALEIKNSSVITDHGTIKADWIISATHHPFRQPLGLFFKKGLYTSYVLELEVAKGAFKEAIYEDTNNPYHYFRVDPGPTHDRLIIGGEDHRADIPVNPAKNFSALEAYAAGICQGQNYKIIRQWHGSILESVDGLPFIGPYRDPHVLYAFGFSGSGLTYGGIAAQIFTDHITSQPNDYARLYRTTRIPRLKALLVKGRDYFAILRNGALKNIFRQ